MAKIYKYKAINPLGKMQVDRMEAENALDLEQKLHAMDLDLINFKEVKSKNIKDN